MTPPADFGDLVSTFNDNTGRWVYEDSLNALVPIDLVHSTGRLVARTATGPPTSSGRRPGAPRPTSCGDRHTYAGVNGDPGKTTLTAVEWFLDEAEPGQEIVLFSAWGFSAKARSMADRLDVALFRFTAVDQVEPFNKVALQRHRAHPGAGGPALGA